MQWQRRPRADISQPLRNSETTWVVVVDNAETELPATYATKSGEL
jgi:hypothetical protein